MHRWTGYESPSSCSNLWGRRLGNEPVKNTKETLTECPVAQHSHPQLTPGGLQVQIYSTCIAQKSPTAKVVFKKKTAPG